VTYSAVRRLVEIRSTVITRERILLRACYRERAGGRCTRGSDRLGRLTAEARNERSEKGLGRTSVPSESKEGYVKDDNP
jgi:hypothetical protein